MFYVLSTFIQTHVALHDDQLPLVSVPDATTATLFGCAHRAHTDNGRRVTSRVTSKYLSPVGLQNVLTVCFVSEEQVFGDQPVSQSTTQTVRSAIS